MKYLLIIYFGFFSFYSFGQSIDNPPKKTWKIIIKNKNSIEDNFILIGKKIVDSDFSIDKKDKDFFAFQTAPKNLDKLNVTYYFNLVARDSMIILTGMSKVNMNMNFGGVTSESSFSKIINKGMNGSPYKESFNVVLKFAKSFFESDYEFIAD